MQGCAWDVWPNDTGAPRIVMGHARSEVVARSYVEHVLATSEDAYLGLVIRPDLTSVVCRRGRGEGSFVWYELCEWNGDHPAIPVDKAAAGEIAV